MPWEIDPHHTLVEFSVTHLTINIVKGRFKDVHGTIHLDTQHPENSWVKARIQAASIDTGVTQRDAHLRSADFFEVVKYPTITFESTSVRPIGPKSSIVTGNLTLHGITGTIELQTEFTGSVRDPLTESIRIGLTARGILDRRAFQMRFNQLVGDGLPLVGNRVHIELRIEALHV
ncbi:YceI family protein [Ktedonospora formicarum]|uniref:Lipid/polyisoprenoid-binding YceI-like domain-containing protein n=1 Tax=Ktedonospora formicarum TaxID=2778364 RepID=A0A8J3MR59_9CHLR|nr:YceI family protein [Ktedonospora formicarum]GHO41975.1 hypothetical protein KSX_01380 [Ktedonospora formicarum]